MHILAFLNRHLTRLYKNHVRRASPLKYVICQNKLTYSLTTTCMLCIGSRFKIIYLEFEKEHIQVKDVSIKICKILSSSK